MELKTDTVREDLNTELVRYLNGQKYFACGMVCYSSPGLNNKLESCYSGHRLLD